jgi:hypothetical protein
MGMTRHSPDKRKTGGEKSGIKQNGKKDHGLFGLVFIHPCSAVKSQRGGLYGLMQSGSPDCSK